MSKGLPVLCEALKAADSRLEIVDAAVYGTECTYERIRELSSLYKDKAIDMVFGMGGGKAMDTAKGAAYELGVPVFTFPTIPSNCASMAALSVVYRKDGGFDSFYFFERPAVHCFINTDIMIHAPRCIFEPVWGIPLQNILNVIFPQEGMSWITIRPWAGR